MASRRRDVADEPLVEGDWSRGIIRDTARVAIPPGGLYDAADFLLDTPGVAVKRGGTAYAGPALTGASFATGIIENVFAGTRKLLAVGSNSHLFSITAGTTTDIGAIGGTPYIYDRLIASPAGTYVVLPSSATSVGKYNGTTLNTLDALTSGALFASYKSRLVTAQAGRLLFSPVPDVNTTWDTANSWIDMDYVPSGLAAINNALLVFSSEGMERIIGATPPPNSDMDRAPISSVGCTDTRSIVTVGQYVYFANADGVYLTNGTAPVSLTEQGGISTLWRSLFTGYITAAPVPTASAWTISCGFYRGFLFVCVLNDSRVPQATLMCNVRTRAWWRLTNISAMAWATSVDGNELYYADGSTNRVVAMSGIFSPAAGNKADADGDAVQPSIEFRPMGNGTGIKAYGFGRLNYDMRDAASDNPSLAIAVKTGVEADTSSTPAESPLLETTTMARKRFTVAKDAQSVTIALTQTGASSKTELYALEVEQHAHPIGKDGVS